MTKVITIKEDLTVLDETASALAAGNLVAFPTETVYGLGANALDEKAVRKIFVAKGRPQDNPLIVHISDEDMLNLVVKEVPDEARKLMDAFWPGPLTIIMEKSDNISRTVTAGLDTVAVRMPAHPAALRLIDKSGVPVAAPSANVSGSPSPTRASHVIQDLIGRVDYIIDGGACQVGLESTVLDLTGEEPQILRPGGISLEQIQAVLQNATYEPAIKDEKATPKSPGMKYRHYAPKATLFLVTGTWESKIIEKLIEFEKAGEKTGVLCYSGNHYSADVVIDCGRDAETYARLLFDALRQMDDAGVTVILAELPPEETGIGPALLNRMLKAAGGRVL